MPNAQNSPNKWIVKPQPQSSAALKLVCLPFAGGSSVAYRNWARYLPASIELCLVEIPGRGMRLEEPLVTDIQQLVESIAQGILPELDRPFALFGHSMGAAVGYELTHFLNEQKEMLPQHLFFSGRGAPHLPDRDEPIHALPKNEFISKIRSYNGTPREVLEHAELMDLMEPILRADFQVCETYNYDHHDPLPVPLTALGGLEDSSAPKADLEAWQSHSSARFTVRMFPGGHFYLQNQVPALIQTIVRDIDSVFSLE